MSFANLVEKPIKNNECHPIIIIIKENVHISTPFKFSEVTYEEIAKEANDLNNKKTGTFFCISSKTLKEGSGISDS